MAEPEWMKKLKFGTSTKKDLKEPKRGDFPKGSTGQSQYNLAWAKWDRTSGNTAVRKKTAKLQDLNTDISRSREDISRFDAALDPTNIQKLSLMRRNQITGYRDAAEANLLETRSKLSAADPTNFGLAVDAANDYSGLGGAFDGKLGYNLQGLKINFDYDDPNNQPSAIDYKTAYNAENLDKFGYTDPNNNPANNNVIESKKVNQGSEEDNNNNNKVTTSKEGSGETSAAPTGVNAGHKNYDATSTAKGTAALSIQKKLLDAGFTQKELNALQENYRNTYGGRFKNLKKKLNIGGD